MLNRKQLYRFLAESIGERVTSDNDEEIVTQADSDILPYIDFGLPSGNLWAKCNLGADSETDFGDYFIWGAKTPTKLDAPPIDYANSAAARIEKPMNAFNDTAAIIKGRGWAVPTYEDFAELRRYCVFEICEKDGVKCLKITSKQDSSKYIFLPFAGSLDQKHHQIKYSNEEGSYWLNSLSVDFTRADYVKLDTWFNVMSTRRWMCYSIRPVKKK